MSRLRGVKSKCTDVSVHWNSNPITYSHIRVVVYGHYVRRNLHIFNQQKLQCGRDRSHGVILRRTEAEEGEDKFKYDD